ncbi:MAG: right-handed parallel beta-helix repeat-containing protein, partial [Gemmatimonadota bacterium]|nr:right-handed parallel beta-helix repeat-containing protein [Gemmatimonadota bacterium]
SVAAGEWYFRQLFVGPSEQGPFERRYRPTEGPFVIAGLTDAPEHDSTMAHRRSQDQFRFNPGDIRRFERIEDVEVVALHSWSSSRLRIREVDLQERIVRFTGHPVYRIGHWYRGGRNPYFVENVREAFGQPGEWYLDRPTGTLSYTPLPGEDPSELTFVAPRVRQLVRIAGDAEAGRFVEHLRLEGLSFAHTRWRLPEEGYSAGQGMTNLPGAVQMRWARRCAVRGCTLAHLGAYAVDIGAGCSECDVSGCRIFDLGGGGVKVGGPGRDAQPPELPTGNLVTDNLVSDGGVDHFSAHGIWVGITDGTRVLHNLVRRFLYSTVSVGWSWDDHPTSCTNNVVAHNHLHDAMMLLSDGGGIYTLGFQPGTALRANRIHDVHSSPFAGGAPNNGIFFDQGSKGYAVEDNVIYATADDPIRFNGGGRHLHQFSGNSPGVAPGEEGFPEEIAAQAGLEPEFAHLDDTPTDVPTTPILTMTPPPPPPIADGFEHSAVGARPGNAIVQGAEEPASIAVTDEAAASGQRSLKITDAAGLTKPFYPYLIYEPGFDEGVATIRV